MDILHPKSNLNIPEMFLVFAVEDRAIESQKLRLIGDFPTRA